MSPTKSSGMAENAYQALKILMLPGPLSGPWTMVIDSLLCVTLLHYDGHFWPPEMGSRWQNPKYALG